MAGEGWHRIATTEELSPPGAYVIEEVRGREVAVFNVDGTYRAVLNFCAHQGGPLCEGGLTEELVTDEDGWEWRFDGSRKLIRCPWHNWAYDVETGRNVSDDRYRVPTYDVDVRDADVYVRIA